MLHVIVPRIFGNLCYHLSMGVSSFAWFATKVREQLWPLEIEPAFALHDHIARFMWPPYLAVLEELSSRSVRVALSAHGQLVRTVEFQMDELSARLIADGIIALFEPDT